MLPLQAEYRLKPLFNDLKDTLQMQVYIIQHTFRRVVAAAVICLCVCSYVSAQPRFEMAVRGGASMLMYESDYGKMQPSYDFGLDMLFSYRSLNVVGFRGGVSFDYAQSKFAMANYADQYHITDYEGSKLTIDYNIAGVTEAHNQMYLSVPLQLALHFGNFAIFLGPKLAFPVKATFKQELMDTHVGITMDDYIPVIEGMEYLYDKNGEGSKRYVTYSGDIVGTPALKQWAINVFASVDINYYIPVSKKSSFGIGLYADYGLPFLYRQNPKVDVQAPYKSSLLWIDDPTTAESMPPAQRAHTSVLQAYNLKDITPENTATQLVRKLNYLSVGIRLSYNIGGEKKEKFKHWYKDLKKCQCVFTN